MFEVELKFILSKTEEHALLNGASFLDEQNFIDIYYDYGDYRLSTNDIWVRSRNNKFILKLPISTTSQLLKEQRNTPKLEIEDENEILKHLKIIPSNTIDKDLISHGILPLYEFRNIRRKYSKKDFIIDLDQAIFKDFVYETCEIELVVASENEIEGALLKIEDFAKEYNIKIGHVEGRLIEYIRRKNPEHYHKLKSAYSARHAEKIEIT